MNHHMIWTGKKIGQSRGLTFGKAFTLQWCTREALYL